MGDTVTLTGNKAVEKVKELANDNICLFCTMENDKIVSRPMATQDVDEDGVIWFISSRSSDKNRQLKVDDVVYLMYIDTGKQHYLSLSGHASVIADKEKTRQLWSPMAKAWFEKGVDDPDITLIRVTPDEGHYWDTKNGKLVSLVKIAVAAVTGNKDDGGIEGSIKL
jgi:general stress protein 26